MPRATVTSKGQITLPKPVREALRISTGDRVAFRIREDGVVELQPETVDVLSLRGILSPGVHGVTLDDMERAIADGASDS